jgi:DNA-binding transcriptional LysR family regulator
VAAFSRFIGYFAVVARVGSIRKASEELNIAASAIDRQILMAERELGTALFERLPSGLRLTAAGEALLAAANRWTKDYEDVRAFMDDLRGLRRGRVRFAAIDALTNGFLPILLGRVHEESPGIVVDVAVLDNEQIAQAVVSGDAEFGLMLNPRPSRDLAVRAHCEVRLGVVMRPDHPLAARRNVHFSVCMEYSFVAPAAPLALRSHLAGLEAIAEVPLRPVAASDNIQMIKSLIVQGVGVSVLSWLDVAAEVERGDLAFVPLANEAARPLTLALCVAPARQLSNAARVLLARIETAVEEIAALHAR